MDKKDFISKIENLILEINKKGFNVKGCSEHKIDCVENKYGKLPDFYKCFMLLMGEDPGDFKKGTDISIEELDDINECVDELMEDNNVKKPDGIFSFLLHQGYSALFFVDRNDDPIVYRYTEGECIEKVADAFSEYITSEISMYDNFQ